MNPAASRLIVTSGPTRQWIDPVRFISNPSSGSTGWNIASAGVKLFREVIFISGPVIEKYRTVKNAVNYRIETTEELRDRVLGCLADDTLLIMAAAPADFSPAAPSEKKIKKESQTGVMTLELTRAPDVLLAVDAVAARYSGLIRVGFAAETNDMLENAAGKLKRKNLDFICANRVYQSRKGFGDNENTLLVIGKSGEPFEVGPAVKSHLASDLLTMLLDRLSARAV